MRRPSVQPAEGQSKAPAAAVVEQEFNIASILRRSNGSIGIQFFATTGKRATVGLGAIDDRMAQVVQRHIEELVDARDLNISPAAETRIWLNGLSRELHDRLVRAGLVRPRDTPAPEALGPFIDRYILMRVDVKPATKIVWKRARRLLLEHFKADRPLHTITTGDARDFRQYLLGDCHLAEDTTRKMCGFAKQFFADALERRLVEANPFRHKAVPTATGKQPKQKHFITTADAAKILDACPNAEWRLLFALSRYGGLRCPSEHLALKWADVDLVAGTFKVTSKKTEHHAGKGSRIVPIFPKLRKVFEEAFDPESVYVVTRYRDTNANLRTQLQRIIRKAGLKPWPKLFNALRATRITELTESFPTHVVDAWLGNSEEVRRKHYLQVTDAHVRAANILHSAPKPKKTGSVPPTTKKPETRGNTVRSRCVPGAKTSGEWRIGDSNP